MPNKLPLSQNEISEALSRGADRDIATLIESGFDKMRKRRASIKRKLLLTYVTTISLVLVVLTGVVGWVYYQYQQPTQRYTDYRLCKYIDEKHGIELTGKREFSYQERSLFGFDFKDRSSVLEKTYIDLRGDSMSIVGFDDKGWSSTFIGKGEMGIQLLKVAHTYIITMERKVAVIDYNSFCK